VESGAGALGSSELRLLKRSWRYAADCAIGWLADATNLHARAGSSRGPFWLMFL